jgi:hypothetical protein
MPFAACLKTKFSCNANRIVNCLFEIATFLFSEDVTSYLFY